METIAEESGVAALSVILPALLLAALVGGLAFTKELIGSENSGMQHGPNTVIVESRTFTYRSDVISPKVRATRPCV